MDASSYAKALFRASPKDQYGLVAEGLDKLNEIVLRHAKPLQHVEVVQFDALVRSLPGLPNVVRDLMIILHRHNDLKLVPKVQTSFRRQLQYHNLHVVEITTADSDADITQLQAHFGNQAVIIRHYDPTIIAGALITTHEGSYELSARSQLWQMQQTLTTGRKG